MKRILLANFLGDIFFEQVVTKIDNAQKYILSGDVESIIDSSLKNNYQLIDTNFLKKNQNFYGSKKNEKFNFDEDNIKFLENKFYLFLQCIDRIFIKKKSTRFYKNYYYNLLIYLREKFIENSIKKVVFDSSPHTPYDVALYLIAKILSCEIFIIKSTKIHNHIIFYDQVEVYEKNIIKINDVNESISAATINKLISNNIVPEDIKAKDINSQKPISPKSNFLRWLKGKFFFVVNLNFFKKKYYSSYSLNLYDTISLLISREFQRLKMLKWLKKNSYTPYNDENYVLYYLHYQPERSTDPESGIFSNQYLAIKLISENLPSNFYLYVREHPRQLNDNQPDIRKLNFRCDKDYEAISSLEKVKIINPNYDSERLYEKAKLVSSLQGSSIWISLLKGKAGFTLQPTWHSKCNSSPYLNRKNISENIKFLLKKTKDQIKIDLENFVDYISPYLLNTLYTGKFSEKDAKDEKLLENLAKFIDK